MNWKHINQALGVIEKITSSRLIMGLIVGLFLGGFNAYSFINPTKNDPHVTSHFLVFFLWIFFGITNTIVIKTIPTNPIALGIIIAYLVTMLFTSLEMIDFLIFGGVQSIGVILGGIIGSRLIVHYPKLDLYKTGPET